jgi:hypothetical protein
MAAALPEFAIKSGPSVPPLAHFMATAERIAFTQGARICHRGLETQWVMTFPPR